MSERLAKIDDFEIIVLFDKYWSNHRDVCGYDGDNYDYKHVLCLPNPTNNIPILNYTFDRITDGENNQSIILKLYNTLPSDIGITDILTIEREVVSTQVQDIYYLSDEVSLLDSGSLPQDQNIDDYIYSMPDGDTYQAYNDLSASTAESILNSLRGAKISPSATVLSTLDLVFSWYNSSESSL